MPRGTQSEYLTRKNRLESWNNVIGFITKVHEHDGKENRLSNHEVNVQLTHREEEFRNVPVHTDHNGSIYVPQKGDAVEVGFLKSQTQKPFVANVVYTDENRAPLARAGHFRREFGADAGDKLYIEAEPSDHSSGDPDLVRIAKKSDGLSDPSTEIVLDDSGSDPEVRINTDSGSIVINDGSQGAITDVQTTKDSDGHVTDITLVRSNEVFIG